MFRRWLIGIMCALPAPALAQALREDPATHCRFLAPDDLAPGPTAWLGACEHALAEGAGVLRVVPVGHVVQLFAGIMHAGRPVRGMVDRGEDATSDNGPAWSFQGAHAVYPQDHAQLAAGYRTAAAGAAAAGARFRAAGRTASAKFYEDWSRALLAARHQNE